METEALANAVIITVLAVPVLRYAVAFQQAEPMLSLWRWQFDISPITGLAFGISYEVAAYIGIREATAARRRKSSRWWWPLAGSVAQTAAGVAIIVPVLVAELQGVSLVSLLGETLCWLWSGVVALATLLCFATVSLALAVQPKPRETKREKPPGFACDAAGCGYVAKSQAALNAHQRKHKAHLAQRTIVTETVTEGEDGK